jgi:Cytochrome C oxidase, cbb3-type, subunit III
MKRVFLATLLALFFPVISYAQMGGGMMGGGMMGPGQGQGYERQPFQTQGEGAEVFRVECSRCHPQGGNVIYPNLPLRGAPQLTDFNTFLAYVRQPVMPDGSQGPMPAYPPDRISDDQARNLYQYLVTFLGSPAQGGPRAGYGMIGRGNGGQYPRPHQKPSKPLDEQQARREVEKYLKSTRNPNLKVGKVEDKGNQYEVTVQTNDGSLVDKILVEKNTGQMKSAY